MDPEARRLVEEAWSRQFGLPVSLLRDGKVHVLLAEEGRNDVMSFQFGDTCIVVVRPELISTARAYFEGLDSDAAFSAEALRGLVGTDAQVDGPSWHGYVTARTFRGVQAAEVVRLDPADHRLLDFLRSSEPEDSAESGFPFDPASADPRTSAFYAVVEDQKIVAAGNLTEWRGLPADVGLLTAPRARLRGLATRLTSRMVADALPTARVVRYRALLTNDPSLALARRLGFEGFGQNYRARRPDSANPKGLPAEPPGCS